VTLTVVFVHHGALVVVDATLELEQIDSTSTDEHELLAQHKPTLERVMQRLRR
jgi:hypothetical protein